MAARTADAERTGGARPPARPATPRRSLAWGVALGIACLAVAVNLPALAGPFLFDDWAGIVENPNLRALRPLARALDAPAGTGADGRPLVALSLALDHALWGLDPRGFRATNLLAHALCALALFAVLRAGLARAGRGSAAPGLAAAATLLWAVHPLYSGALHQVIYRNEVLAALFYLVALGSALALFGRPAARIWAVVVCLASAAAMASKETAVSLPLAVLALDRLLGAGSFGAALRARRGFYAALASTWLVLLACVLSGSRGASVGFAHAEIIGARESIYTQAGALLHYLRLSFWPAPLVFDYSGWPVTRELGSALPAGLVVLALLVASAIAFARRRAAGYLGLLAFAVLAPSSSFIPLAGDLVAERRMYLPLAALVAIVVLGVDAALGRAPLSPAARRALGAGLLGAAALALGATSVARARDHADAERIWRDTVTKRPTNARAWNMLGVELGLLGRRAEAAEAYQRALEVEPHHAQAAFNLGNLHLGAGEFARAAELYAIAARGEPGRAEVRFNHGSALALSGRAREGMAEWRAALELAPELVPARRRLAWALATQPDPALRDGRAALELALPLARRPGAEPADLDLLAAALAETGAFGEARRTAQEAAQAARALGRARQAATFAERAESYAAGRAWRQGEGAREE